MKALALALSAIVAVSACRRTKATTPVRVVDETTLSTEERRVTSSGDPLDGSISDMRCAKVFSFLGCAGAGAQKVAGSVGVEWLFTICETRERRIRELYIRYYCASIEGKAYILWGLYALDAKQFTECEQDFLKQKNLLINNVEACQFSKLSCSDFIALLKQKSRTERLKEITSIYPPENDEMPVGGGSGQAGTDQPSPK